MDLKFFLSILTLCITILGWKIVDVYNQRRDSFLKRKNIRIDYLINAWRLLESASNRNDDLLIKNIETAIADIQLFGTQRQILLAQKIAVEMQDNNQADTLDLLKDLRKDLRNELNLESVSDNFKFFRYINETNSLNNGS